MRIRNIDRAINAVINAKQKLEKMNEKYPKMYTSELQRVGDIVIDKWYATYQPIFYHRKKSLYNAFKISLHGLDYNVTFSDSLISGFHDNNEYIYDLVFMKGYHGGAINGVTKSGEQHPHPGVPYWKTPFPELTHWGKPAKRSWSPYYAMVKQMKEKIKEIDEMKQKEFDSIMNKVMKTINNI